MVILPFTLSDKRDSCKVIKSTQQGDAVYGNEKGGNSKSKRQKLVCTIILNVLGNWPQIKKNAF